jgi:hypothetical protein
MKLILFAAAVSLGGAAVAQITAPAGGETVAPGNTAPERDARGIPVISDPATAPAGVNGPVPSAGVPVVPAPNQAAAFATQPSTDSYPPCSREVTDNCVQTYERGSRRPD